MQETAVPSSRPVRGESALGGGVEVQAWGPHDGGSRMESTNDTPGTGASPRSGVSSLGSGQVCVRAAGGAHDTTDLAGNLADPAADDQRSSTSLMVPARQRRSADELRRRQAKTRVRQNARRTRK